MVFKLCYGALTVLLLLSLAVTLERQALAYVDPGSGLLVLQSLGAVVSGGLFYFRKRLRRLFFRDKVKAPEPPLEP